MLPPLVDMLEVATSAGALVGAAIGLFVSPSADREVIDNIGIGAGLGALAGAFGAFFLWLLDVVASN